MSGEYYFHLSSRRNKQHGAFVLSPKTVKFSFPSKAPIVFKYSIAFSTCRMKLIDYIINRVKQHRWGMQNAISSTHTIHEKYK